MEKIWKASVWRQFGAAIDMLENALRSSPDELWEATLWDEPSLPASAAFWNLGYHTLFWLDLYLSGAVEGFAPPAPFTLDELEAGKLPRTFTRDELLGYLAFARQKCQATVTGLTDEQARRICRFRWGEVPFTELLLYNMRHVQEHAAQLNMLLGQTIDSAPGWVSWGKTQLSDE